MTAATGDNRAAHPMTIPHSDTVTRDGTHGKRQWFGKFVDDFETLAGYLNENH